jgi:uroporphyrinogen III methyltransferase/synthase
MTGKVTFVGAGPGDPRLLTLRAASALEEADVVLFDPDVHPDVLGRLKEGTPRHPVTDPVVPERVGQMLVQYAKDGRNVVRATWGDPLFFGSSDAEVAVVARENVPFEIVPGVDPLVAVSAFAGVPLTRSSDASQSVAVVRVTSGAESLHDWHKLAMAADALAILCDPASVGEIARSLVFYGRAGSETATLVENVSLPTQRTRETTLSDAPLLSRSSSARVLFVVGERATPAPELGWLERLPLFGKRILVARAREQAGRTAALLRERGADPVVVPMLEILPPTDSGPMEEAAAHLDRYGWVVLTSANGVERLLEEVFRRGKDARAFGRTKIAVVGPGTAAALERFGLRPDLVASDHKGEGVAADLLAALDGSRPRILVARAEIARDVVPDALREAGCAVDVVPTYRTCPPPRPLLDALAALLDGGEIDAVTFTSSSTVEHLCDALGDRAVDLLGRTRVASIGPITSDTARKRGLRVDVTAGKHTIEGLVAAIEGFFELSTTGTRPRSGSRGESSS